MSEQVLVARAFLSRVAEPASVPLWMALQEAGPVEVARRLRAGDFDGLGGEVSPARVAAADPSADVEAADRYGIRLVVPESDEWPHFAFSALEAAARRRAASWRKGDRTRSESGDPIPPVALWVRGRLDLATVGVRSVAIVGSRASTRTARRLPANSRATWPSAN